jgi:hypothetical protein
MAVGSLSACGAQNRSTGATVTTGVVISNSLSVYLHFPCFDGVVSAVLACEYLQRTRGWTTHRIIPIDYDQKSTWAKRRLKKNSVVVDFLYHPDAAFWADHHETTFLSESLKVDYERRQSPDLLNDPTAQSCAQVLWRKVHRKLREPRFREMVHWAQRIDSARYGSVQEAVLGEAPALQINLSLLHDSGDYCRFLVNSLRERSLSEVASSTEVAERYAYSRQAIARGQALFGKASRLERGGIVVFEVAKQPKDTFISRYAPYLVYPDARYSIGILPYREGAKITAMRNPWRRFESRPLGQIFRRYGGGGHQRVASLLLKSRSKAESTLNAILSDIRSDDIGTAKRRKSVNPHA